MSPCGEATANISLEAPAGNLLECPPSVPEDDPSSKRVSSLAEFGSRLLRNEEDVFQFNAWDNCDLTPEMLADAQEKIQNQSKCTHPEKYHEKPAEFWNAFYQVNQNKFFKDRRWLKIEFPELFDTANDSPGQPFRICEIGCGAGNTVFPFLEQAQLMGRDVFAYACDYSKDAIQVVQSNPLYDETKCKAIVYDITSSDLPPGLEENSLDVCVCIFVLSALHPRDWEQAVRNLYRMLKPGGLVLLRDYGR